MTEIQKTAEQTEQNRLQKIPEAAAASGVIDGQQNQEVHALANAAAHANDKTLSEPDLIAMEEGETIAQYKARVAQIQANRFGFFDSEKDCKQVFEKAAKQAIEPIPPLSPTLNDAPYNSTVKLNVQITNVPEVSEGVKPEETLQHLNQAFEVGAQTVRPIKQWMATSNAVNETLGSIGPYLGNTVTYFSNTRSQHVSRDLQTALGQVGETIDNTLSNPHGPKERARTAGNLIPFFFFEGNANEPVHPGTVKQFELESMSEAELLSLGIRRAGKETFDLHMPELPPELRNLDYQLASPEILEAMAAKGRTIVIATEGSEDLLRLERAGAQGSAFGSMITIKPNARKITALEEFLHGTQEKLGFFTREADIPFEISEVHVKDFMIRHARLLGLESNDLKALQWLKEDAIERAQRAGFIWKE